MTTCCLCGGGPAGWCRVCGHAFCDECKKRPLWRTRHALEEWILKNPPRYCAHRETEAHG